MRFRPFINKVGLCYDANGSLSQFIKSSGSLNDILVLNIIVCLDDCKYNRSSIYKVTVDKCIDELNIGFSFIVIRDGY